MGLEPYWREFKRYLELLSYQLWDFVIDEVVDHPLLSVALAVLFILVFAWRLRLRN